MARLGSDDTPVRGERLELPGGWRWDVDDGDLVARDTAGTVVLRYDEAAETFDAEGRSIEGVGSLTTEDLEVTNEADAELVRANVLQNGGEEKEVVVKQVLGGVDSTTFDIDFSEFDEFELIVDTTTDGGTSDITMTVSAFDDGEYNYITRNGSVLTEQSEANEFVLMGTPGGSKGRWKMFSVLHFGIFGNVGTERNAFEPVLLEGWAQADSPIDDNQTIELEADEDFNTFDVITVKGVNR